MNLVSKEIEDIDKIKYDIDLLKARIDTITNAKFRLVESNVNIKCEFYKSLLEEEAVCKEKLAKLINNITFINNQKEEK